jgi:hypothetical protein
MSNTECKIQLSSNFDLNKINISIMADKIASILEVLIFGGIILYLINMIRSLSTKIYTLSKILFTLISITRLKKCVFIILCFSTAVYIMYSLKDDSTLNYNKYTHLNESSIEINNLIAQQKICETIERILKIK